MIRRTALVALLLLPAPALAWEHVGWALAPEDLPLRVTIEAEADVVGLSPEQVQTDLGTAVAMWSDASCGYEATYGGPATYEDPTDVPAGELHLSFADLGPDSPRFVRLGALPQLDELYVRNGRSISRAEPGAWVINTHGGFTADAVIDAGECVGGRSLSTVVGVLIGYASGLGPTRDPSALMASSLGTCMRWTVQDDDIEGLHALYGPWAVLSCSSAGQSDDGEIPGVVPFEVTCEVQPDLQSTVRSARWTFGDGTEGEGSPVSHTYTSDDNYSVRVVAELDHATCGPSTVTADRANYVRACDEPRPEFRVERSRGLRFRLVNASDVRTYGCHDTVLWEVFDSAGELITSTSAWEPLVEFPEEGEYRVVLTLGGPAGSTSVEGSFDTREGSVRGYTLGSGCTSTGLGGLGLGGLGWLGWLIVRRRRTDRTA